MVFKRRSNTPYIPFRAGKGRSNKIKHIAAVQNGKHVSHVVLYCDIRVFYFARQIADVIRMLPMRHRMGSATLNQGRAVGTGRNVGSCQISLPNGGFGSMQLCAIKYLSI